jgi:DNA-directed RNA polymerase specialized sigma24 family protein
METSSFQHDPAFMEAFWNGDNWAFRIVFDTTIGELRNYLYSNWPEIATDKKDDFISSAYYNLFKNRLRLKSWAHIRRHLYISVKHRVIDDFRIQTRLRPHVSTWKYLCARWEGINSKEEVDYFRMLSEAVNKLPKKTKKVIYMSFYEGKEPKQIAAELGSCYQTILNLRNKGVDRLRELLPFSGRKSDKFIKI